MKFGRIEWWISHEYPISEYNIVFVFHREISLAWMGLGYENRINHHTDKWSKIKKKIQLNEFQMKMNAKQTFDRFRAPDAWQTRLIISKLK